MTVAIALAMVAPAASAAWYAYGTHEPDSSYDTSAYMWGTPPTGDGQIYFNAFYGTHFDSTKVNPNVGQLGTRFQPAPSGFWQAILGVWKDCNQDGVVGYADSAVLEYRQELLTDSQRLTVCPVDGFHNDGAWILELVMIGMVDPSEFEFDDAGEQAFFENKGVWYSNVTMWSDIGRPPNPSDCQLQPDGTFGASCPPPGGSCPLYPLPRGATSTTGVGIRYVDCVMRGLITRQVNTLDPDGSRGLGFDECDKRTGDNCRYPGSGERTSNPQKSHSLLNQDTPVSLLGNPYSGQNNTVHQDGILERNTRGGAAFTVWDCGSGTPIKDDTGLTHVEITDPETGNSTYVNLSDEDYVVTTVYGVKPGLGPGSSVWDGLEHVDSGVADDCDTSTGGLVSGLWLFDLVESRHEGVDASAKDRASQEFTFFDGARADSAEEPAVTDTLGERAPLDAGLGLARNTFGGPSWSADSNWLLVPQTVDRGTLRPDTPVWWTHYVTLDMPDLRLKRSVTTPNNGEPFTYTGNCPYTTMSRNNVTGDIAPWGHWVCDPDDWYVDPDGSSAMSRYGDEREDDPSTPWNETLEGGTEISPRIGMAFHLRDVDCFDGRILRGSDDGKVPGVYASLTPISATGDCDGKKLTP